MFHVVIPARFAASRLPGKPLLIIGGRPLIQWVWQGARASGAASVIIATDDVRIFDSASAFRRRLSDDFAAGTPPGTDRIAEVARAKGFAADDIVVNLQGDEPLMPAAVIGADRRSAGVPGRRSTSPRPSRRFYPWRNFSIPTA